MDENHVREGKLPNQNWSLMMRHEERESEYDLKAGENKTKKSRNGDMWIWNKKNMKVKPWTEKIKE
jgi:hypothetical protein